MTAITLVHNASAGVQPIAPPTVLSLLCRAGYRADYVSVKRTPNLTAALLAGRSELVAVAGGDGTVADVLRAGRDLPLKVAILPSGVANNIARSLGIASALPRAATSWRTSRARPVQLATIAVDGEERMVVEGVGLGALAMATRTMKRRKSASFARAGVLAVTRRHFRDVLATAPPMSGLTIDGTPVDGQPLFAEILNIPLTGPNLSLTSQAALGDGNLTVVYATAAHRRALVDWLGAGAHASARPALPTLRARAFTIDWADGPLRIDDEVSGRTRGRLTIASRPVRIQTLAPR